MRSMKRPEKITAGMSRGVPFTFMKERTAGGAFGVADASARRPGSEEAARIGARHRSGS